MNILVLQIIEEFVEQSVEFSVPQNLEEIRNAAQITPQERV